jgi:hypothetical protein
MSMWDTARADPDRFPRIQPGVVFAVRVSPPTTVHHGPFPRHGWFGLGNSETKEGGLPEYVPESRWLDEEAARYLSLRPGALKRLPSSRAPEGAQKLLIRG